jgi:hypothetical protein
VQLTQNNGLPIYNNGTGNAYTISMWVKGAAQNVNRVFSEGSSSTNNPLFAIGTNTSGKIRMYIRDDSNSEILAVSSSTTVFDNNWHHIAWVDNNGTAILYVDGAVDGSNFNYTRGTLTMNRSAIGAVLRSSAAAYFSGQIDEVSLWNVAGPHWARHSVLVSVYEGNNVIHILPNQVEAEWNRRTVDRYQRVYMLGDVN